jgi:hypothetical protein
MKIIKINLWNQGNPKLNTDEKKTTREAGAIRGFHVPPENFENQVCQPNWLKKHLPHNIYFMIL